MSNRQPATGNQATCGAPHTAGPMLLLLLSTKLLAMSKKSWPRLDFFRILGLMHPDLLDVTHNNFGTRRPFTLHTALHAPISHSDTQAIFTSVALFNASDSAVTCN
jgi:hypothetical protein